MSTFTVPLYGRRVRQQLLAAREAAGEDLWTESFSQTARVRLWEPFTHLQLDAVADWVDRMFRGQLGMVLPRARRINSGDLFGSDLAAWWFEAKDSLLPSAVEAIFMYLNQDGRRGQAMTMLSDVLNTILDEERIAFDIVDGLMVPFESQELHREIVLPTLTLLSGRSGWEKVEEAYTNALRETSVDPSDAITDAGTALQQALEAAGARGNQLGDLIRDARKHGLLAPYDGKLTDAVALLADWVAAERSQRGDAHVPGRASQADAWLAVHVAGALILRLAAGTPRD